MNTFLSNNQQLQNNSNISYLYNEIYYITLFMYMLLISIIISTCYSFCLINNIINKINYYENLIIDISNEYNDSDSESSSSSDSDDNTINTINTINKNNTNKKVYNIKNNDYIIYAKRV